MPQRKVYIPPIGEVVLARRRGAKSLRLSVTSNGVVRVSMPYWTPFSAGIHFAASRQDWVLKQLSQHNNEPIGAGAHIGKHHTVVFYKDSSMKKPGIRVKSETIEVKSANPIDDPLVQAKLLAACQKALKIETLELLAPRLKVIAREHGFKYKKLRVRKLVSRWGSCSSDKTITLNYYLVQLPWELIDYVITHELVHTKHLHHGPDFWQEFLKIQPDAKELQRRIRSHSPGIHAH